MITPLVAGRARPFQHELVAVLRRAGFEIHSADLTELALDNQPACRRVLARSRADIVIDCSGADDVEPGEPLPTPEQLAACENLAVAAAQEGVHSVLVSSACVFGNEGRGPRLESDPPAPETPLAAALVAVERAAARANPDHTIVRSSRLYGRTWNSPFEELITSARANQTLFVERRRISPPTYGPHLASVLVSLVRRPCHGIIHRTAGGVCDELELARSVLGLAGLSCVVEPGGEPGPHRAEEPVFLASCRDEVPAIPHWRIGLRTCALERNRSLHDTTLRVPVRVDLGRARSQA
ncbi:MAG: sugar nucleotide-binding protein, partial [Solirubrobacterales bacterium]|nr:sugar nucleotide-binding protein [Solirubrobacterales bacterium]